MKRWKEAHKTVPEPKRLKKLWMTKTTSGTRIALRVVIKSWCVCSQPLADFVWRIYSWKTKKKKRKKKQQQHSHLFLYLNVCNVCKLRNKIQYASVDYYHCHALQSFSFFKLEWQTECRLAAQQDTTWFHLFHLFYDFFFLSLLFIRLYYSAPLSSFSLFSILFGSLKFQNQFIEHQLNGRTLLSPISFFFFCVRVLSSFHFHSLTFNMEFTGAIWLLFNNNPHDFPKWNSFVCIFAGTFGLLVSTLLTNNYTCIYFNFFFCRDRLVGALCAVLLIFIYY